MLAKDLKKKYLEFFAAKQHKEIPSAPLIPENDPTVLFTTAGMHPLVPFLLGQPHPLGKRLVDVQKCLRTDDIDEVGDASHLTFFEMLGNWSLGDYFKEDAIKWSYEFLTKVLKLDVDRISVTVFAGDKDAPKDDESADAWLKLGIPKECIFYNPKKDNWWGPAGKTGPCGPCTEMFYDTGRKKCSKDCVPGCSCGKYFEIWNDVFMEYNKVGESYEKLKQHNVDTGMGLERTAAMLQGKDSVYDTEIFAPIMDKIRKIAKTKDVCSERIIADHLRAAVFILAEGIAPSNVGHGYILRRLIRRAIRHGRKLGIDRAFCVDLAKIVVKIHEHDYPELTNKFIIEELSKEEERFERTLENGMKKFQELSKNGISGKEAFLLFQSYGFPLEMTEELAKEKNVKINKKEFQEEFAKHQELSRKSMQGVFKSGLADNSEMTVKYHTATHLLHQALREVLGSEVAQRGSNITPERLRFDFSFPRKMTDKEIKDTERLVNEMIKKGLCVSRDEMSPDDAKHCGAIGLFGHKYGERVFVYIIGDFSKEICSGPHVENISTLGYFAIVKEEAVAAGVRRIKAVLE